MSDPILDAHEALPGIYLISGRLSPISIRDQMLRGRLVVDRLLEQGEIHKDHPLLVIGAGVGGATAAICAAENNVPTTLFDKESAPFTVQRDADTRHLNPTQYDWPVDHWPYGVFPWGSHTPMPLSFPSDTGSNLAARWTSELNKAYNKYIGLLNISYSTTVTSIAPCAAPPLLEVTYIRHGIGTKTKKFAAVVWASGAGPEECRLYKDPKGSNADPLYEGRAFWSHDPFSKNDCGVSGGQPYVLISGGGDGGLQDYLRIVTRHEFAEEFYRKCNIPQEIADQIQSSEDRVHRGRAWVNEDKALRDAHEGPYLAELQQTHDAAADDALSVTDVRQSLEQLFKDQPHHTVLAYRESYFTSYYGLNRFLVLLVAKFLKEEFNLTTLRPQTIITDISTANTDQHQCMVQSGSKWEPAGGYRTPVCHGKNHEVTFRDRNGYETTEKFNVIVVRHGLHNQNIKLPLSRSRHLLPYHLPL